MKKNLTVLKVIIPPFEKISVGTTLLADPTRTLALEYYEFVCQGVRFTDFFFKESTFSKHVLRTPIPIKVFNKFKIILTSVCPECHTFQPKSPSIEVQRKLPRHQRQIRCRIRPRPTRLDKVKMCQMAYQSYLFLYFLSILPVTKPFLGWLTRTLLAMLTRTKNIVTNRAILPRIHLTIVS